jgi:hypothetical protein
MRPRCRVCDEPFPAARKALKYTTCLKCGDGEAVQARRSWCVVQEYGKGGYQYVTREAAARTLRETNQKQVRS